MRLDFEIIADWIDTKSRVLDFGCEDGSLLVYLRNKKQVQGIGVDRDESKLTQAIANEVEVIQMDIRRDLSLFANQSFDYVVLSQTLQSIDQPPQFIIDEMLRIGRIAVVSFPNFGYWRHRLQILGGYMPVGKKLPYQWYDTPYVRYCTIADFQQWCHQYGFNIKRRVCLNESNQIKWGANLKAVTAIYQLSQ